MNRVDDKISQILNQIVEVEKRRQQQHGLYLKNYKDLQKLAHRFKAVTDARYEEKLEIEKQKAKFCLEAKRRKTT